MRLRTESSQEKFIKKNYSNYDMKTGTLAPQFSLPDQKGQLISLTDFSGKWVILYFYPKDDTPGCSIEAVDFSALQKQFLKEGAVIMGISPDSTESHCHFIDKKSLKIILLSDQKKEALLKYKVWGKKKFMGKEYLGVLRTTFLIDPNGIIKHIWTEVKVKDHAQQVLELLRRAKE